MGRRIEKKSQTRQQILAVAERLFREQGYERTSVNNIFQAAGISRMTFFNYFPDRTALLTALATAWLENYLESFDDFDRGGDFTSPETFLQRLETRFDYLERERDFLLILARHTGLFATDERNGDTGADATATAVQAKRLATIERAQREGRLRADIPAAEIRAMYALLRNRLIAGWLAEPHPDRARLREEFARALSVLSRGLQPQHG